MARAHHSWILGLVLVVGCVSPHPPAGSACGDCHGSAETSAPPAALGGFTDPSYPGVGAHEAHSFGTRTGVVVACEECHLVPASTDDEGHTDTPWPAEVIWGPLSKTRDAFAPWDRAEGTCTVYCHGAAFGSEPPEWTDVDGSASACGACHGNPPPPPHPAAGGGCDTCHGPLDPSTHMDGVVQDTGASCVGCHGTDESLAPPPDTEGNTESSARGVGFHASHDGPCSTCHVVPATVDDPGHIDPAPSEVVFSGLAVAGGAMPRWEALSCVGTYCHGATLTGGIDPDPSWTESNGIDCVNCHGTPPPLPHPQAGACGDCHPPWSGPLHQDGETQTEIAGCGGCHGTADNDWTPPPDVAGNVDTFERGVGAHEAHADSACDSCHVVPAGWSAPGHIDPAPSEVVFGGVALANGATPAWDAKTLVCSDTWCHGVGLTGGAVNDPDWTTVDGSQGGCGACHGNPPPAPHTSNDQCADCHPPWSGPEHVDGIVQSELADCGGCHGPDAANLAPPPDSQGNVDPSLPSVGAHAAHAAPANAAVTACEDCHVVPAGWSAPGHIDPAPSEVVLGGLAAHDGASPAYDFGTLVCANTYCHGTNLANPDGNHMAPVWNVVDGSQSTCRSCHGMPPGGGHPPIAACETCHGSVAAAGWSIIAPDRHVDGVVDF